MNKRMYKSYSVNIIKFSTDNKIQFVKCIKNQHNEIKCHIKK